MKKIGFILALALLGSFWRSEPKKEQPNVAIQSCSVNSKVAPQKVNEFRPQNRGANNRELASLYFEKNRSRWGIQDYHSSNASEFTSPLGDTFIYEFSQSGIPIVGMTIRLRVNLGGEVVEEENTYRPIPLVEKGEGADSEAVSLLQDKVIRYKIQEHSEISPIIFVRETLPQGELAFSLQALDHSNNDRPTQLLVRAADGKLLQKSVGRSEFK